MTEQMLKIQENSNRLGLLAQKMEDDIPMSTSSKQNKHFFGLRKKKSGSGNQSNNQNNNGSSTTSTMTSIKSTTASESRSSTLTSLQNQEIRPQSPDIDNEVASSSSGSLATMSSSNLSSSNPSIGNNHSLLDNVPKGVCVIILKRMTSKFIYSIHLHNYNNDNISAIHFIISNGICSTNINAS